MDGPSLTYFIAIGLFHDQAEYATTGIARHFDEVNTRSERFNVVGAADAVGSIAEAIGTHHLSADIEEAHREIVVVARHAVERDAVGSRVREQLYATVGGGFDTGEDRDFDRVGVEATVIVLYGHDILTRAVDRDGLSRFARAPGVDDEACTRVEDGAVVGNYIRAEVDQRKRGDRSDYRRTRLARTNIAGLCIVGRGSGRNGMLKVLPTNNRLPPVGASYQ